MTSLNNELRYNRQAILKIKRLFSLSPLNKRITSLIVHGSCLYREVPDNGFTDIDLELILTKQMDDDYQTIKNILSQIKIKTELQLRYKSEIENSNNLIRTLGYKLFTFYGYANGICLIGDNIYQQLIKTLDSKQVKHGILISVQLAYKDYRKIYLNKNSVYMVNKNIMVFLLDILMYEGILDYRKLGTEEYYTQGQNAYIPLFLKHFGKSFSVKDKIRLENFVQFYKISEIYEPVFPVIDKIALWFSNKVATPKGETLGG